MPTIRNNISLLTTIDREFVGTVAFKNEKISLPDGSKVAIGMDGSLWVVVYQETPNSPFVVYEFNVEKRSIIIDKKQGGEMDMEKLKKIVDYFYEHAEIDDLVTIEPGERQI